MMVLPVKKRPNLQQILSDNEFEKFEPIVTNVEPLLLMVNFHKLQSLNIQHIHLLCFPEVLEH